jgi:uncharacterized protein YpmB
MKKNKKYIIIIIFVAILIYIILHFSDNMRYSYNNFKDTINKEIFK